MQLLVKVATFVLLGHLLEIRPIDASSELLEISCDDKSFDQCKQFQDPTKNITAKCIGDKCQCAENDETTDCTPTTAIVNNIITGNCPCNMKFSECIDGTCYCEKRKIPSMDMRQCLDNIRQLDHSCEYDKQCQRWNKFSVCNATVGPSKRNCNCRDGFFNYDGECYAFVAAGPNMTCLISPQCDRYGQAFCHLKLHRCLCKRGLVGSENSKRCYGPAKYEGACVVDEQCQYVMGMGAMCHYIDKEQKRGSCICKAPYVESDVQYDDDFQKRKIMCVLPAEIGDYCYDDEECKHPGLTNISESLHCFMGACKCKGVVDKLTNQCVIYSGFTSNGAHFGIVYLDIAIHIIKAIICRISVHV